MPKIIAILAGLIVFLVAVSGVTWLLLRDAPAATIALTGSPTLAAAVELVTPTSEATQVPTEGPTVIGGATETPTATPTPAFKLNFKALSVAPKDWCDLNTIAPRGAFDGFPALTNGQDQNWSRIITATVAARYVQFGISAGSLPVTEPVTVSLTAIYGPGIYTVGYWQNAPKFWTVRFLTGGKSAQSANCRDLAWDTGLTINVSGLGLVRVYILTRCGNIVLIPPTGGATATPTGSTSTPGPGTNTPSAPTSTPGTATRVPPSLTPVVPTATPTRCCPGGQGTIEPSPPASPPGGRPTVKQSTIAPTVVSTKPPAPGPTNTPGF